MLIKNVPLRTTMLLATLCLAAPLRLAAQAAANPRLTESPLPLHYPPFDKIKNEHYSPAYELGMAEHLKEVDAIANNPAKPTFENTIVALEKAGQLLDRVSTI